VLWTGEFARHHQLKLVAKTGRLKPTLHGPGGVWIDSGTLVHTTGYFLPHLVGLMVAGGREGYQRPAVRTLCLLCVESDGGAHRVRVGRSVRLVLIPVIPSPTLASARVVD
jgi:hypothetical protein